MSMNEIDELIKKRQGKTESKKSNQILYAIIVIIIVVIIFLFIWKNNEKHAYSWILGVSIGIVLRYSRFCFAAAFRDPFLTGNTKILRGMLLGIIISTLGFAIIQSYYIKNNGINYNYIPGSIGSVGAHVALGAFIFGIGMILAGGCGSGVLMRIGEGHALQWIVLLGFLIGAAMGAKDYSFWYQHIIRKAKTVYFPEYMNFKVAVVVQTTILIILYKIVTKLSDKKR
ncbi:YeeE/YedE thiosulfate transporter family protein [Clostridium tetani]|uniref:YeeE/YedE thiosulfate transporter family protein n=1 Tax=Clostridium tetani TaxID=1513 RepID=UPI00100A7B88|nr:YeeE/YedE thiosulfate transporter family protein [Clostridium tetani]RXM58907.1 transporter [Clostridium tetani]RXM79330.1 transporter [Clostridium tetani]RYV00142.1 transporter [Clostridium tetani]